MNASGEARDVDLVVLLADLDAEELWKPILMRAMEPHTRCMKPIRWTTQRDPSRDALIAKPGRSLVRFDRSCHVLVLWDHHGSNSRRSVAETEQQVIERVVARGFATERVLATAFDPELEALFAPAWSRVAGALAQGAQKDALSQGDTLTRFRKLRECPPGAKNLPFGEALQKHPKEMFEACLLLLGQPRAPRRYKTLGETVGLKHFKKSSVFRRIAERLEAWFPPET